MTTIDRATVGGADYAAYLDRTPNATPFHSEQWGRAIETSLGHRWTLLLARDTAGQIVGALPLHHVRSPLFGASLVSTGFAVGGGILCADANVGRSLADAAWALAGELNVPSAELRGGWLPGGEKWIEHSDAHVGFVRPLAADSEAELLAIPRKHRAEVRKALASDLTVRIGTSLQDRRDHYRIYAESVRNLGTPVFPRKLFDGVLDAFGQDADILTVLDSGKPVSSVLNLYWKGHVMPYWGGGTADARRLRGNELMYFRLMDHARERGMTHFDFGRSKVGTGPAAYKKNWGFTPEPLRYAVRTADGAAARDINPNNPKYQQRIDMWKKLPLPIANMLGPWISRGLG